MSPAHRVPASPWELRRRGAKSPRDCPGSNPGHWVPSPEAPSLVVTVRISVHRSRSRGVSVRIDLQRSRTVSKRYPDTSRPRDTTSPVHLHSARTSGLVSLFLRRRYGGVRSETSGVPFGSKRSGTGTPYSRLGVSRGKNAILEPVHRIGDQTSWKIFKERVTRRRGGFSRTYVPGRSGELRTGTRVCEPGERQDRGRTRAGVLCGGVNGERGRRNPQQET